MAGTGDWGRGGGKGAGGIGTRQDWGAVHSPMD